MVTDQERVIQAGCNACVSKPVDFNVLRKHLKQWLMVANVLQDQTPAEK
jgi:CheY-like chemotaxis protein